MVQKLSGTAVDQKIPVGVAGQFTGIGLYLIITPGTDHFALHFDSLFIGLFHARCCGSGALAAKVDLGRLALPLSRRGGAPTARRQDSKL